METAEGQMSEKDFAERAAERINEGCIRASGDILLDRAAAIIRDEADKDLSVARAYKDATIPSPRQQEREANVRLVEAARIGLIAIQAARSLGSSPSRVESELAKALRPFEEAK